MKRTVPFALAAILTLSFASISIAQTALEEGVNIMNIARVHESHHQITFSDETQRQAQAELESDAELKGILEKHSVELNNVVGIQVAADGSRIVYVK